MPNDQIILITTVMLNFLAVIAKSLWDLSQTRKADEVTRRLDDILDALHEQDAKFRVFIATNRKTRS